MIFERATTQDADEILGLYKSLVGTAYCAWTDVYPEREEIDFDLSHDALFCYREEGQIISVISIDYDEVVRDLPCWTEAIQPSVEISRIGVRTDYQNQGIAGKMIFEMMEICKAAGKKSIHFLVAKTNLKAQKAYNKLHFNVVGECSLYNEDWWCYEKELQL
jgi:ribosomal protein S18 acetylase RimI-like enzyme